MTPIEISVVFLLVSMSASAVILAVAAAIAIVAWERR